MAEHVSIVTGREEGDGTPKTRKRSGKRTENGNNKTGQKRRGIARNIVTQTEKRLIGADGSIMPEIQTGDVPPRASGRLITKSAGRKQSDDTERKTVIRKPRRKTVAVPGKHKRAAPIPRKSGKTFAATTAISVCAVDVMT